MENLVRKLSHCYCHKLTGGQNPPDTVSFVHRPGFVERLLLKLVPHFDIIKSEVREHLCPYCVLDCDYCEGKNIKKDYTVLYLRRFYLFRSKWLGLNWGDVYLHHIVRSDDDPDPHDHPWAFRGFVLAGGYTDQQYHWLSSEDGRGVRIGPWLEPVKPRSFISRAATHIHRVLLNPGTTAWTLIFTSGYGRDWNFITPTGPVLWRTYLGIPPAVDIGE